MGKVFPHFPRRKPKAQPRPPAIVVEDPAQRRARVAAQRREAERIEADRRARMEERRVARNAREAQFDALEAMAGAILPWDLVEDRRRLTKLVFACQSQGKRPLLGLALLWAGFVLFDNAWAAQMGLPIQLAARIKAACPVTLDPEKIELLIEFVLRRALIDDPDCDAGEFRDGARLLAHGLIERRKEKPGQDYGDGWLAGDVDIESLTEAYSSWEALT